MGGLPRWPSGKESPANAGATGDVGLIPGWEDRLEGEMPTYSRILAGIIPWVVVHVLVKSQT